MRYNHTNLRTRDDLEVEVLYVNDETDEAFYTPDAIGLIFFDTEEEGMIALGTVAEECRLLTADEWERMRDL